MRKTLALISLAALFAYPSSGRADPPTLRAAGTLREGLRIEACRAGRCEPWVRFPAMPYRSFVEAKLSPSGDFFYVWTRADGRAREIDVFATPQREGQLANRRGHWSPGAGGEMVWVAGDHLWHRWGCGVDCSIAQLYTVTGNTVFSSYARSVTLSPDRRHAAVVSRTEGELVDLQRGATRAFRAPAEHHFADAVTWGATGASVWFSPDTAERDDDPGDERVAVQVVLPSDPTPAAPPVRAPAAVPASPTAGTPGRALALRPRPVVAPSHRPVAAAPAPPRRAALTTTARGTTPARPPAPRVAPRPSPAAPARR